MSPYNLMVSPLTPNSRSYLNHFTQPDTIVSDQSNPQAWDRYTYTLNNPLKYTDPSGHDVDCGLGDTSNYCINRSRIKLMWDPKQPFYGDKKAAEEAYLHFLDDPMYFIEQYVNPQLENKEYADLTVFATYSKLGMNSADQLILNTVSENLGVDAADALQAAQMNNVFASFTGGKSLDARTVLSAAFVNAWYQSTFPSAEASLNWHYGQHGGPWSSPEAYTQAAQKFYNTNVNLAEPYILEDGEAGLRIVTKQYYGIYTTDGRIVSFTRR
jgi:hypothetical protein